MTSQPPPAPGEGKSAGQFLRPLRDLAAYALVGAPAVFLLVALIRLIPGSGDYSLRTQDAFYGFVNIETVFFPLAAVLLALLVQPRHPKAQLIVMAAAVEYAVAAFFGVIFGLLLGVIDHASNDGARTAFEELLVRLAWLGLLAVAGYAAFQIWRGMFHVPRPQQQPGVYGQPPRYSPAAYPGQPGYGQPPHPGQPGFGQPPHPGQPGFGQPPHPGQPQPGQAPHPGQPHQGYAPPSGFPTPQSAPPAGYGPGIYGQPPQPPQPPAWNQPPVTIPATTHAEPTQVVPSSEPEPPAAETATIEEPEESKDRPGFGPAEPDPPRH